MVERSLKELKRLALIFCFLERYEESGFTGNIQVFIVSILPVRISSPACIINRRLEYSVLERP